MEVAASDHVQHCKSAKTRKHAQQTAGTKGVLVGKVTIGPISPVQRSDDSPQAKGLAGAHVVVSSAEGKQLKEVITDQDGSFRVCLPPGSFRIEMSHLESGRFTKDVPTTVTIVGGQETHLDIRVDTGIR
jgi:hypothetical protein